jgi:hypothetical protein
VFLSARCARLPGLHRALEALQVQATTLPDDALTRGCLHNLRHIIPEDGELRLVTRLPLANTNSVGAADRAPEPPPPAVAPTHALHGHEAVSLAATRPPLPLLGRDGARITLQPQPGVLLNGVPVEQPRALAPGDRVAVGEHEYLLIRVLD